MSHLFGLDLTELADVRRMLQVTGIDLCDLKEFLLTDKVQLFAKQQVEIKELNAKIDKLRADISKLDL